MTRPVSHETRPTENRIVFAPRGDIAGQYPDRARQNVPGTPDPLSAEAGRARHSLFPLVQDFLSRTLAGRIE
jgi:hypothetical protein